MDSLYDPRYAVESIQEQLRTEQLARNQLERLWRSRRSTKAPSGNPRRHLARAPDPPLNEKARQLKKCGTGIILFNTNRHRPGGGLPIYDHLDRRIACERDRRCKPIVRWELDRLT